MPIGVGDVYAKRRNPHSFKHLDQIDVGGREGSLYQYLYPHARQDAVYLFDDFTNKAVDTTNRYTTGETGTGTPFATPATVGLGGTAVGVTGTSSGDAETLRTAARLWRGQNNCWMEMRAQFSAITTLMYDVGFIDSASDLTISLVSDIDTPALAGGTSDVAILHMDTSQTLTTTAFLTDGSVSNQNTTAITLSPAFTPTAATYHIFTIGIAGNIPFAMVDGQYFTTGNGLIGQQTAQATLLQPWFCVRTRTTAAKTATLDYLAVGQDRLVRTA